MISPCPDDMSFQKREREKKKSEIPPIAAVWTEVEDIMLNESGTETQTYAFSFMCDS